MRWLRRLLVVVLGVVVLVTFGGAGWVVSVDVENSRDERAFIQNLDRSVRGNLCAGCPMIWKFPPVDDDFLIAEGDRACAWLHDQPYPWWSRAARFTFDRLMRRYLAANPVSKAAWSEGTLRPGHRSIVVGEAWHELCGDAWEMHEPHNPFNRPPETD
jgi:hypothetical protein